MATKVPWQRIVVRELSDDSEIFDRARVAAKLDTLHFDRGSDVDVWFTDRATGREIVTPDQVDWRFHRRSKAVA